MEEEILQLRREKEQMKRERDDLSYKLVRMQKDSLNQANREQEVKENYPVNCQN